MINILRKMRFPQEVSTRSSVRSRQRAEMELGALSLSCFGIPHTNHNSSNALPSAVIIIIIINIAFAIGVP
jgi:hypothetical protein